VDNTRDYARVSHSRQWSNYNIAVDNNIVGLDVDMGFNFKHVACARRKYPLWMSSADSNDLSGQHKSTGNY